MDEYKASKQPSIKHIAYWYIKDYTFIIAFAVLVIILIDFEGLINYKILLIILSFFIPFTFPRDTKRKIYACTFDDVNKEIIIYYFILWKKRKKVAYNLLHFESVIKTNRKNKQEALIISLWKQEFILGDIVFPSNYELWDRKQVVELSKKFNEVKHDNQTYKPKECFTQEIIGKAYSLRCVEYFT